MFHPIQQYVIIARNEEAAAVACHKSLILILERIKTTFKTTLLKGLNLVKLQAYLRK